MATIKEEKPFKKGDQVKCTTHRGTSGTAKIGAIREAANGRIWYDLIDEERNPVASLGSNQITHA